MRRVQQFTLAAFPALVAFLLIPLSLYVPNQRDFDFKVSLLIPFIIALAVACAIIAIALATTAGERRERLVKGLFWIGAYLLLADLIAPWQVTYRPGGFSEVVVPWVAVGIAEIALAGALIYAAPRLPVSRFAGVAALFVASLCAIQTTTSLAGLSEKTQVSSSSVQTFPPPAIPAKGGNVYHITFDEFNSHEFGRLVRQPGIAEGFEGFTFFERNRANHVFTWVSVASFMSGSLLGPENLERFMSRWKRDGLLGRFYEKGYTLSTYVADRSWIHQRASHVTLASEARGTFQIDLWRLADIWSSRIVPNLLHPMLYEGERGPLSRFAARWVVTTPLDAVAPTWVSMLRQMMVDEASRPANGQYVYVHAYLPHYPYVLNEKCEYGPSDYRKQARCTVRLMKEFIEELKRQGKYDSATIVFQADHGYLAWVRPDLKTVLASGAPLSSLGKELAHEVEVVNYRSEALLAVKPPDAPNAPLAISGRATQLADVARTLGHLKGINTGAETGVSVFQEDFPERRAISVYIGFDQFVEGRRLRFGQSIFEADWGHYTHVEGEGWRILPRIHVRWN